MSSEHVFALECDALADAALVGFRGTEGLSRLFSFDVFVTLVDVSALDDILGEKVSLWVEREPRYGFHGIAAEVELLHEMTERSLARVTVVPRLFKLSLSNHSRMFTGEKIPDIIEKVLTDAGLSSGADFELKLGSYEAEEHVCQYDESDLTFLMRWMEHEGMFFYFDHDDGVDKLVISDDSLQHAVLPADPIRYYPTASDEARGGIAFRRLSSLHRARPKKVGLRDYDYANPSLDVEGEGDAFEGGFGEVQLFGDDRFFAPGRGAGLAKRRAEEHMASQRIHQAVGHAFHLRSGYGFKVIEHPVSSLNKAYLCVELEHYANLGARTAELQRRTGLDAADAYRVSLTAIDASTPFRAGRTTPKPRVFGYLTGLVDGPADSDYAQIDDQGRYNIILHFDESGLDKGSATTALRMMQPHAGNPEGMHFPLRKGTEVMVSFLDGDPDRPLIAGAMPNAHNPSPVTEANHTHNIVHTGGDNIFDFEDQDGGQWITFSTPTKNTFMHLGKPIDDRTHHIMLHTDGNNLFDYGTNQDIKVGAKLDEIVEGAVTETYKSNQTSTVMDTQTTTVTDATEETYKSTQTTITIGQVTEDYKVPQQTTVSAAPRKETFLASQTTDVTGGGLCQQLNGAHTRIVAGNTTNNLTGTYSREATGAVTKIYAGNVLEIWGPTTGTFDTYDLICPGNVTHIVLNETIQIAGDQWFELVDTEVINFKLLAAQLVMESCIFKRGNTGAQVASTSFNMGASNLALGLNGACFNADPVDTIGKVAELNLAGIIIKI